ncbi:hypothetical protein CDAR_310661 [Caerostris darwini]|uniref:Uncharacterized protein n=1 Tax=Caerostris darwini TaxID=1538125 RepID=A0AAV4VMX4_9ARAC|nr:hypothetical protein CDAR_310661 [Caerostris darwini]
MKSLDATIQVASENQKCKSRSCGAISLPALYLHLHSLSIAPLLTKRNQNEAGKDGCRGRGIKQPNFEQNRCTRTKAEDSTYPFTTSWKALVSALNSPLFTVPQQWKHSSMLHPVLYARRVSLTQTEQLSDFVLQGRGDGMEL